MLEDKKIEIKKFDFQEFNKNTKKNNIQENINILKDVPLELTVELGRTNKSIKEILSLVPGSIIELEQHTNEPVNIFANGKLVAKGEIVVIDENLGIRITNIIKK